MSNAEPNEHQGVLKTVAEIVGDLFSKYKTKKSSEPESYLTDAMGRKCPYSIIDVTDLARHELVNSYIDAAHVLQDSLAMFKAQANEAIDEFNQISASQYGIKKVGEKGGVSLFNYNQTKMIKISTSARFVFNEHIQHAKQLLDEFIEERSENIDPILKVLIADVFQVDHEGNVDKRRVLDLRKHKFEDEKWRQAMKAIEDARQFVDRKAYVQFFERENPKEKWKAILLDLAKV